MSQTWIISGPPGCGKTTWILNTLKAHSGSCGYLRLEGLSYPRLEQGNDANIDWHWLKDQIPHLNDLRSGDSKASQTDQSRFNLIELPHFHAPDNTDPPEINAAIHSQLIRLNLNPQHNKKFGRDPEFNDRDTLSFSSLESWSMQLSGSVWDPNSLSSFWFELVNGAYGDVYRAKALMNLPDGRAFLCNWILTQEGSQFLPLDGVEPPNGRPKRSSALVVQGKAINGADIQSTINDCLLNDEVLEMHQAQRRSQQPSISQLVK